MVLPKEGSKLDEHTRVKVYAKYNHVVQRVARQPAEGKEITSVIRCSNFMSSGFMISVLPRPSM